MFTNPLRYFDRIYVINLPYRTDRRREMNAQLHRLGLALDREPVKLFAAVRPADSGKFDSIGAHGCFLSHSAALHDAAQAGYLRILILEDDVDFTDAFVRTVGTLVAELEAADWNLFYGGWRLSLPMPTVTAPLREVSETIRIDTSHFVAFRQPAIGRIAQHLDMLISREPGDPLGGPMHVDGAYNWFRRDHSQLKTFISSTELGTQRSSRTDIHALRWYDRWPLVRSVAGWGRRLRSAA